ncbi:MAG: hypothetical protein ACOX8S_08800 [Christensenellales bacterium]|jgi:hypothetical protein
MAAPPRLASELDLPETRNFSTHYTFMFTDLRNPVDSRTYWITGLMESVSPDVSEYWAADIAMPVRWDWMEKLGPDMPESMEDIINF